MIFILKKKKDLVINVNKMLYASFLFYVNILDQKEVIFIKELPHVFKKNVDSVHINNKNISYVRNNSFKKESIVDIVDKLDKLFKSSRYVFNIGVIIKTKNKVYDTKIMSRNKTSILTINDEVIPIKDIYSLTIKDRYQRPILTTSNICIW